MIDTVFGIKVIPGNKVIGLCIHRYRHRPIVRRRLSEGR